MGLFRTKRVKCPAGEWTTLISNAFVQIPMGWVVRFRSEEDRPVEGSCLEKRHLWLFPQAPVERELWPEMHFERGWINTFYSVKVRPVSDLVAEID